MASSWTHMEIHHHTTHITHPTSPNAIIHPTQEGQPLRHAALFEDIMQDYANRTVTVETHPHTGLPQASIHPCQVTIGFLVSCSYLEIDLCIQPGNHRSYLSLFSFSP